MVNIFEYGTTVVFAAAGVLLALFAKLSRGKKPTEQELRAKVGQLDYGVKVPAGYRAEGTLALSANQFSIIYTELLALFAWLDSFAYFPYCSRSLRLALSSRIRRCEAASPARTRACRPDGSGRSDCWWLLGWTRIVCSVAAQGHLLHRLRKGPYSLSRPPALRSLRNHTFLIVIIAYSSAVHIVHMVL
jgi:hypothetical protein